MKFVSIFFAFLLSATIGSVEFVDNNSFSSSTCQVDEIMKLRSSNARHSIKGCSKKDPHYRYTEKWYNGDSNDETFSPKRVNKTRPKYKIRDTEICIPGAEAIKSCLSNPEQYVCSDESYPFFRQYIGTEGKENGNVLKQYSVCPEDPPDKRLADSLQPEKNKKIEISPEKFRSFPILASKVESDPQNFSLRNGYTHYWAIENEQNFNSNLSGHEVRIKAIPVQWIWKYGDGTMRRLNYPGEPAPEHTLHDETNTSHVYKETGKFQVVVTTLYRGEFSVDGGPWEPIPGQASVPSEPSVMDVWRTKKELIATD